MESIIETFHLDWQIIIAQAVNFAIVFAVLYYFAIKPLNKLMAERSQKIAKGLSDAKRHAELVAETKAEYEKIITKARGEAVEIFQTGKKDADTKRTEMLETAKREVETLIKNGKMTLEAEKVKMIDDAKKEIVGLAMAAVEKLVSEKSARKIENFDK